MFFVYRFRFTVWDHLLFLPEELSLVFLVRQVWSQHIVSVFGYLGIPLFFKISFAGYRIFGWRVFVFLWALYIWFFPPLVPNSRARFLLFACLFIYFLVTGKIILVKFIFIPCPFPPHSPPTPPSPSLWYWSGSAASGMPKLTLRWQ